jgi:coenzyme F420-0:L-glutamate ligase / coenzyme F420-1:gamma-L-glutamate ligase
MDATQIATSPAPLIPPRRMIRRYTDAPIDDATIGRLLESATQAPSPHNRQPWRFAVLRGPARERLATAMAGRLRQDLTRDGVPEDVIARDTGRSRDRILAAPVSIVVCLSMRDMDVYPDAKRAAAERWMAVQAVACAVQSLLLSVSALGLGACWMCAPLFCPQTVRDTVGYPEDWEAQALITIGHPADAGRDRGRVSWREQTLFTSV